MLGRKELSIIYVVETFSMCANNAEFTEVQHLFAYVYFVYIMLFLEEEDAAIPEFRIIFSSGPLFLLPERSYYFIKRKKSKDDYTSSCQKY